MCRLEIRIHIGGTSPLPLARQLDGCVVYGLRGRELETLPEDVPTLADTYAREISGRFPSDSMCLLGWSAGGIIGYELAARLESMGSPPKALILLDSYLLAPEAHLDTGTSGYFENAAAELGIPRSAWPRSDRGSASFAKEAATALGITAEELDERARVYAVLARAVRGYKPRAQFTGRVHVVSLRPDASLRAWQGFLEQPHAIRVTGDHYSILRHPDVANVAAIIQNICAESR